MVTTYNRETNPYWWGSSDKVARMQSSYISDAATKLLDSRISSTVLPTLDPFLFVLYASLSTQLRLDKSAREGEEEKKIFFPSRLVVPKTTRLRPINNGYFVLGSPFCYRAPRQRPSGYTVPVVSGGRGPSLDSSTFVGWLARLLATKQAKAR